MNNARLEGFGPLFIGSDEDGGLERPEPLFSMGVKNGRLKK
jgi:hypothetical protein